MDKKVREVILYLLENTEEYQNDYYVPTEKEMDEIRIIYKDAPKDYLDFLESFGNIGGALEIFGVAPKRDGEGFYLNGLEEEKEIKEDWNLNDIILLRFVGNGDFDFIDLNKSTNEKSAIFTYYHDDSTFKQLEHKSFFTYVLEHMLMFLEDEFDDKGKNHEYDRLQEMLARF